MLRAQYIFPLSNERAMVCLFIERIFGCFSWDPTLLAASDKKAFGSVFYKYHFWPGPGICPTESSVKFI